MTATSSDLALTVTATRRGAGKEASAHLSRDESQSTIPLLILDPFVRISRRAALLKASSGDPAPSSEDLAALAWILQSLEDIEATIIGLSEVNRRRSAAFQGPAPLLPEAWFPTFRWGQPAAWISAPADHAGRYRFSSTPGAAGLSKVPITALRVRIHDHARSTRMSRRSRSNPEGTGRRPG